jgi:hypothetical protein
MEQSPSWEAASRSQSTKSLPFMEPESSLPSPQEPVTRPYPEPD